MPRVIPTETEDRIELGDLAEMLASGGFDPRDEENFVSFGPALKKLANNRGFLAEIVIEELKARCRNQVEANQYTPQVIMLHSRASEYLIRANIWPAAGDSVVRHSGTDPFFYGKAHDHNFSFLTVGYLGPGYWSEYYEYDYASVAGYPGEKVELRYVEKSKLDPGKVMLYRIHRDVHLQLPADALSVSLNILESAAANHFLDQYQFDVERSEIMGSLTRTSIEPLLALSAHFGGEDGMDLIETFAQRHPSDSIRFQAVKAKAAAAGGLDRRISVYERAARSDSRLVSALARQAAEKLERGRDWIDGAPLRPAA
ncbi:MAG TPA: transposase [Allosphingosinicella sp.]|nr:transposase [Allosphingosinicella sp.]